jgi:hypothetical protein
VLVSWWSVNFVSVVVGVLVALWWCVHSVLTVSGDVLGVLFMFWVFPWCLGSVPVVSWWYWRNGIFLTKLAHLSTQKLASKETRNFAVGGVCWVNWKPPNITFISPLLYLTNSAPARQHETTMPASHRNGAEAERRKCWWAERLSTWWGWKSHDFHTKQFKEENLGPWEEDQAVVSQLVSYD